MRFTPSVKTVKFSRSKIFLLVTLILSYSLLSTQQLQGQENQDSLYPGYVEVFEVSGLLELLKIQSLMLKGTGQML